MQAPFASNVPDRPGKTSVWTTARAPGKYDLQESQPDSTQPPSIGVGSLDNVRSVFWQAYRHLFPPHALAAQTPNGSVVISWSIMDEPNARYPYAAPVMLRFDDHLMDGDYVVIERRDTAKNGEQVVALLDTGEATLKRYFKEGGNKVRLQPANKTMEPRVVDADKCRVQGVVIGVLRTYAN